MVRMRLVDSSDPGAISRDEAARVLVERAVLTRLVIHEVVAAPDPPTGRRTATALDLLLDWVRQTYPQAVRVEPHPGDGLELMHVPPGLEAIHREIEDGARVCDLLFLAFTADTRRQLTDDVQRLRQGVDHYLSEHPDPVPVGWRV